MGCGAVVGGWLLPSPVRSEDRRRSTGEAVDAAGEGADAAETSEVEEDRVAQRDGDAGGDVADPDAVAALAAVTSGADEAEAGAAGATKATVEIGDRVQVRASRGIGETLAELLQFDASSPSAGNLTRAFNTTHSPLEMPENRFGALETCSDDGHNLEDAG